MWLSCCTDAPARYKENYSSHVTIAGVKTIAGYFLPNSTPESASPLQMICFAEGRQVWGTPQLSSCKGTAQHLEGHPHTHDDSGSGKMLLDFEKSKTLSQKHPEPGEAGRTGHILKNKRLDFDMTDFNQKVTEKFAVLKKRLHLKIFQKYWIYTQISYLKKSYWYTITDKNNWILFEPNVLPQILNGKTEFDCLGCFTPP